MIKVPRAIGIPLVAAWGCGVLYYTANSAIYYPFQYPKGEWALRDALGAADVWLHAADGVKLHGLVGARRGRAVRHAVPARQRRQHHARVPARARHP